MTERWFAVSYPFLSQRVCNVRLALIMTAAISFVCLLIGCMQIFVYHYDHTKGICGDHPEFNDPDSMRTKVFAVWNILFDLVFFIICSLLILFFNIGVIVVTRRSAKSDLVRHTQRLKSVHLQMTPIPLSSSVASQSQSPLIAKRPIVETRSSGAGNGDVVGGSGNGNAAGGGGGGGGGDCDGGSNPRTPRTPTFGRERAQSDMPQLRPASSSYSPAAVSAIPRRSVLLRAPENGSSSAATDGSGNGNSRTSLMRRKSAGSTGPKRPDRSSTSESRKSAATTVALLSISFYYILTTLPVAACMVIAPYFPLGNKDMPLAAVPEDPEWRAFFAFRTVRNIIVDLAISHYALFFYVYLLTSPAFRRAALQVLARYVPCVFRRCYERERRRALLASTALNTGFGSTPTTFTTVGSSYSRPHSTLSSQ